MSIQLNSSRLDFLDALRGCAALSVAYFHYARYFLNENIVTIGFEYEFFYFFNNYIDLGKVGVIVFFAISGIVIPFSLARGGQRPVSRFVIGRFARLYPIYWCSIPAGIFAYWYLSGNSIGWDVIAVNFTMLQQFFLIENVMGLYWTLQVELIFYGLCVVLFYMGWLNRPTRLFYISLMFLLIALVASWVRYYFEIKVPVALFLALTFMFWGAVWREYIINGDAACKFYGVIILTSLLLVMPVISVLAYNQDMGFSETWYRYLISYYTAMVILVLFTTKLRVQGRLFSWLGRISYSVYLFHGVVFIVFMYFIGSDLLSVYELPAHFYVAICILLTLGLSQLTYTFIEQPMINVGRKWNSSLKAKVTLVNE